MKFRWTYVRWVFLAAAVGYYFLLPSNLFEDPHSTVIESRDGRLLAASIASDGQWRFPATDTLPAKFRKAITLFEDRRFYWHPGVDPVSILRALQQNITRGEVVSGGSTLTMQLVRLSRKGKQRTLWEKTVEMILATRLELRYSKNEILALYSSHAPFGGNVVGVEAACWRYFGRSLGDMSWGEAALLAVLPNAPALIHPGRNRERLVTKRNLLLDRLQAAGEIDSMTCYLAKEESIPEVPFRIPRHARHLLTKTRLDGWGERKVRTTIDYNMQASVEQVVDDHHRLLVANQVHNAAAIVLEVETGNVLAYVGNVSGEGSASHGGDVDIIQSRRSTGSILKPFLYAAMLDEGRILPGTLLPDVPTLVAGFAPTNFSNEYDGAVSARQALTRSLNVPAVHLLMEYRYEKFHSLLRRLGMSTLVNDPDRYGLSLILGGAEGTLWELSGMYASMARTLEHYFSYPGKSRYETDAYHPPTYIDTGIQHHGTEETSVLSAASLFQTFDILTEVYRPGEQSGWRYFQNARKIAWKTGTSFGFRDAWAIGVTPEYVVGVWVGNADGEGRPGLTGTDAASPVMFDIFSNLPQGKWFSMPQPELFRIPVCSRSGMRVSEACEAADTIWVAQRGLESNSCTYHTIAHVTPDRKYQVHSQCEELEAMIHESRFVLPPVQEYYYRSRNLSYKPLPPYRPDCQPPMTAQNMELVYPKASARIYIPRELKGDKGKFIVEMAHRNPGATVYWHLDGVYLGATRGTHRLPIQTGLGFHELTLVDDSGEELHRTFEVASRL